MPHYFTNTMSRKCSLGLALHLCVHAGCILHFLLYGHFYGASLLDHGRSTRVQCQWSQNCTACILHRHSCCAWCTQPSCSDRSAVSLCLRLRAVLFCSPSRADQPHTRDNELARHWAALVVHWLASFSARARSPPPSWSPRPCLQAAGAASGAL